MTEADDAQERSSKGTGRRTVSVEGRRVIGQAVMDGILNPGETIPAVLADYLQFGGNYTQSGGGNYIQWGGGNYTQSPLRALQAE